MIDSSSSSDKNFAAVNTIDLIFGNKLRLRKFHAVKTATSSFVKQSRLLTEVVSRW